MDAYGKESLEMYNTSSIKLDSEKDSKLKSSLGTSSEISKYYKVFLVDEPSELCGRVLESRSV